jgi:hypothetical protein
MNSGVEGECPVSVRHCAKKFGVEPKNIRDWRRQVMKIRASEAGAKCIGSGRKPDWPEMEQLLHDRFKEWRNSGRRVDHSWFFRNGKEIFEDRYPDHVTTDLNGQKKYTLKYVHHILHTKNKLRKLVACTSTMVHGWPAEAGGDTLRPVLSILCCPNSLIDSTHTGGPAAGSTASNAVRALCSRRPTKSAHGCPANLRTMMLVRPKANTYKSKRLMG